MSGRESGQSLALSERQLQKMPVLCASALFNDRAEGLASSLKVGSFLELMPCSKATDTGVLVDVKCLQPVPANKDGGR